MWYHPAGIFVEKRDVIGAWVAGLFVTAACFGVALETSAATRHAAAGCERLG